MTEEEIKNEEKEQDQKQEEEKPLDKMKSPELGGIVNEISGVTGAHAMKKDELVGIVKESRGIKDEEPEKKEKKKAPKINYNLKELKEKVGLFRKEKEEAQKTGDRHRLNILRRRINRLKKMTRKAAA
jgi:hypothetical protein